MPRAGTLQGVLLLLPMTMAVMGLVVLVPVLPQLMAHFHAVPGVGTGVPIWILGSSLFGAQLAAMLGLPYSFASHFAPDYLLQALLLYRGEFRPSPTLASGDAWW